MHVHTSQLHYTNNLLCSGYGQPALSFQDFGVSGALEISLPLLNDHSDGPFIVPGGGIPYLVTEMATDVYVR